MDYETWGLIHVDSFKKMAMEKYIIDIMKAPRLRYSQIEKSTNSFWFDNQTKGINTIDSIMLVNTIIY